MPNRGLSTHHRRQAGGLLLGLSVGIAIVMLLAVIVQQYVAVNKIEETTTALRDTQKNSVDVLDVVLDCTRPAGKCFRDGQRRTAAAVENISDAAVYAAFCAAKDENDTVAEIETCVLEQFELARSND